MKSLLAAPTPGAFGGPTGPLLPMSESNRIDPLALSVADAARLLSKGAGRAITTEQIESDLAAGLPRNADGTISLITYAAWLSSQRGPNGD